MTRTTSSIDDLNGHKRELKQKADEATRAITHVINAFSQLITFFTGGGATADRR